MIWRDYKYLAGIVCLGIPEFGDSSNSHTPCRKLGNPMGRCYKRPWLQGAEALWQGGSRTHQEEHHFLAPKLSPGAPKETAFRWLRGQLWGVSWSLPLKSKHWCCPSSWLIFPASRSFWATSTRHGLRQSGDTECLAKPKNLLKGVTLFYHMRTPFFWSTYHRILAVKILQIW